MEAGGSLKGSLGYADTLLVEVQLLMQSHAGGGEWVLLNAQSLEGLTRIF